MHEYALFSPFFSISLVLRISNKQTAYSLTQITEFKSDDLKNTCSHVEIKIGRPTSTYYVVLNRRHAIIVDMPKFFTETRGIGNEKMEPLRLTEKNPAST